MNYIEIPKVPISRQNMLVWKEFSRQVILQEMNRRKVTMDELIEELVIITKAQSKYRHRIMRSYLDPNDSVFFTYTRFNMILPTLLKWRRRKTPSILNRLGTWARSSSRLVTRFLGRPNPDKQVRLAPVERTAVLACKEIQKDTQYLSYLVCNQQILEEISCLL
jgi:hypothetical protein